MIDGVGPFGGASRSLYEALRALPAGSVDVRFVAVKGTVVPFYTEVSAGLIAANGLTRFDNTRYSHYRGLRWLVLLRELFHVPHTIAALVRARRLWASVDVIHANEITEILPALLARWIFRAPVLLHVRSLQRVDPRSWRCRWFARRLRRDIAAVVAIDENVRLTLPADIHVDIVHNSFTSSAPATPSASILERLGALRPESLKVGFVGNLHRSKGIFDLLAAAKTVVDAGVDAEFVVVGGATRADGGAVHWMLEMVGLSQDVASEVEREIAALGLERHVHLIGPTIDIQLVYERIDVLCFPSHFDAPGRPVFEAAFSSVPSITAVTNPREDTLSDGQTGIAVPGEDPPRLAAAIAYFAEHRDEVARMGANARVLAERNFEPRQNAEKLLAVYRRVASRAPLVAAPPPTQPH